MKRWIPLIAAVLLISAAPAFAQSCAYCNFNGDCEYDGTYGALDCKIHNPGLPNQWCEEVGFCPLGLASETRSFNANWKVTNVRVLTADGAAAPKRTDVTVITVADRLRPAITER